MVYFSVYIIFQLLFFSYYFSTFNNFFIVLLNKGLGYTKDMLTNLEKMAKINLEEDEPEFDI